jgi:competence protein ComEA
MLSRLMTLKEQALIAAFAAALVLGAGTALYLRAQPPPTVSVTPASPVELNPPASAVDSASAAQAVPAKRLVVPEVELVATERAQQMPPPMTTTPMASEPAPPPIEPPNTAVAVAGAVRRPGLYRLKADARIQDLLDAAGGIEERADTSSLNLSARLIDGTTLTVPESADVVIEGKSIRARGATRVYNPPQYTLAGSGAAPAFESPAPVETPAASPDTAPVAPAAETKIDLNYATQQELETLPGIGPALAQRIIAQRPFARVEDLTLVTGIAEKRYDALAGLVTVSP